MRVSHSVQYLMLFAALAACTKAERVIAQTPDGMERATVEGHDLFLRPGFHISVFAQGLRGVRYLALGPGNVVYASRISAGTILRLPDANHDGVADTVITVAEGLHQPFGLAFRGDTMYVGETDALDRFNPGATTPLKLATLPSGQGHSTRTVVVGPDNKLYVAVGSSCNICDESDPRRAAVVQYNPDGTGEHLFARGLRNSVGLAFNPTTHELWANNNDRDNLGDDLPPEHVNILKDGKFYGWPQCYLPGKPNPEYPDANCATVAEHRRIPRRRCWQPAVARNRRPLRLPRPLRRWAWTVCRFPGVCCTSPRGSTSTSTQRKAGRGSWRSHRMARCTSPSRALGRWFGCWT